MAPTTAREGEGFYYVLEGKLTVTLGKGHLHIGSGRQRALRSAPSLSNVKCGQARVADPVGGYAGDLLENHAGGDRISSILQIPGARIAAVVAMTTVNALNCYN